MSTILVGKEIDGESWYTHDFVEMLSKQNTDLKQEIERLNNIINELEKWLYEKAETETEEEKKGYFNPGILRERATLRIVYDYLQELKGSDKE